MPRRILKGIVESVKDDKTVSVRVERTFRHPLYKKTVRKSNKYATHAVEGKYKVGDKVKIQECRPISKTKSWVIIEE